MLLAHAFFASTAFLLEHPQEPFDNKQLKQLASIWRLLIMRIMVEMLGIRRVHLLQGLFGAVSPKPTCFLVNGLQSLEDRLEGSKLAGTCQGRSIGRKLDGSFATAELKEYPSASCREIAQAVVDHARRGDEGLSADDGPGADATCREAETPTARSGCTLGPEFPHGSAC